MTATEKAQAEIAAQYVSATNPGQRFPLSATYAPLSGVPMDHGVTVYVVTYLGTRAGLAVRREDADRLTERDVRVLLQR